MKKFFKLIVLTVLCLTVLCGCQFEKTWKVDWQSVTFTEDSSYAAVKASKDEQYVMYTCYSNYHPELEMGWEYKADYTLVRVDVYFDGALDVESYTFQNDTNATTGKKMKRGYFSYDDIKNYEIVKFEVEYDNGEEKIYIFSLTEILRLLTDYASEHRLNIFY